ncbi:hypothetical protein DFH11DRAFT_1634020 [Phellopilus nigrolimitatus]|nr:hypothetical protein DFH11DRAFT_1634020 [Phellopilus nigrolimitatus]
MASSTNTTLKLFPKPSTGCSYQSYDAKGTEVLRALPMHLLPHSDGRGRRQSYPHRPGNFLKAPSEVQPYKPKTPSPLKHSTMSVTKGPSGGIHNRYPEKELMINAMAENPNTYSANANGESAKGILDMSSHFDANALHIPKRGKSQPRRPVSAPSAAPGSEDQQRKTGSASTVFMEHKAQPRKPSYFFKSAVSSVSHDDKAHYRSAAVATAATGIGTLLQEIARIRDETNALNEKLDDLEKRGQRLVMGRKKIEKGRRVRICDVIAEE